LKEVGKFVYFKLVLLTVNGFIFIAVTSMIKHNGKMSPKPMAYVTLYVDHFVVEGLF